MLKNVHAQTKDTVLHQVAVSVCNCLKENNADKASSPDEMQEIFMKCIVDSAGDQLEDMIGNTNDDPETAAQEFGTKLAMEMMRSGCKPFMQVALQMGGTGNLKKQLTGFE